MTLKQRWEKLEFQHIHLGKHSHILPTWGNYLLSLANDLVR